eukprot:IDg22409t1
MRAAAIVHTIATRFVAVPATSRVAALRSCVLRSMYSPNSRRGIALLDCSFSPDIGYCIAAGTPTCRKLRFITATIIEFVASSSIPVTGIEVKLFSRWCTSAVGLAPVPSRPPLNGAPGRPLAASVDHFYFAARSICRPHCSVTDSYQLLSGRPPTFTMFSSSAAGKTRADCALRRPSYESACPRGNGTVSQLSVMLGVRSARPRHLTRLANDW